MTFKLHNRAYLTGHTYIWIVAKCDLKQLAVFLSRASGRYFTVYKIKKKNGLKVKQRSESGKKINESEMFKSAMEKNV